MSHNLATVVDSDVVVVLEQGMVVERGAPHDLLQVDGGRFRGLVDAIPEPQRSSIYAIAAQVSFTSRDSR